MIILTGYIDENPTVLTHLSLHTISIILLSLIGIKSKTTNKLPHACSALNVFQFMSWLLLFLFDLIKITHSCNYMMAYDLLYFYQAI